MNLLRHNPSSLFALLAFALSGCADAPEGCLSYLGNRAHTQDLATEPVAAKVRLTDAAESLAHTLTLRVTGLPKLWSEDGAILSAHLILSARWSYDEEISPNVATGTEFPQFTFTAQTGTHEDVQLSHAFATSARLQLAPLFQDCSLAVAGCCRFGSEECELSAQVQIERLQGAPFPAVFLDYSIQAAAMVDTCPLRDTQPELVLQVEE